MTRKMHTDFALARYRNFCFVGPEPVDCIVHWCPQKKQLEIKLSQFILTDGQSSPLLGTRKRLGPIFGRRRVTCETL